MKNIKPFSPTVSIRQTSDWPELRWTDWKDTEDTLHLWMQIIGKIKLALATRINHWWHTAFYPTASGLTTSPMPYESRSLQIDFDFLSHQLIFQTSDGMQERLALAPTSLADFYAQVMEKLEALEMPVKIRTIPSEISNPIPFEEDYQHASYDAEFATRFWKILLQTAQVFTKFRAKFIGKVSPVHFFWGGLDLAVTRFSGRIAPKHASVPNIPDSVVQTAYSHEVSSLGFWPGGPGLEEPIFYAYAYPSPSGFSEALIRPQKAYFHPILGEFILPYETVRLSVNPEQTLLEFAESTYEAAADLAQWNRKELEAMNDLI